MLRGQQVERWAGRKPLAGAHYDEAQKVCLPTEADQLEPSPVCICEPEHSSSGVCPRGKEPLALNSRRLVQAADSNTPADESQRLGVIRHLMGLVFKNQAFCKCARAERAAVCPLKSRGFWSWWQIHQRQASMCPQAFPAYCLTPLCQALQGNWTENRTLNISERCWCCFLWCCEVYTDTHGPSLIP